MDKVVKIIREEYKRFFVVIIATIIYMLGLIWFLQPANLYSGGVVGLVQLIVNIIAKFTGVTHEMGLFIFVLNIPILFVAFKYVSFRFAIYSLISIVIQTIMTSGFLNPNLLQLDDPLLQSMIGGCLIGFGGAMALRFGVSTGGIDIFAQAIALKKDYSIGLSCLIFNICIALIGGFVLNSWAIVFYTVIRIITTSIVTDKVHTIYNHLKIEVITDKGEEISNMIMQKTKRGVTIVEGEGAYTHNKKYVLNVVLSSFELSEIISPAKEIDSHVFIFSSPVKGVVGNFKKRTIA